MSRPDQLGRRLDHRADLGPDTTPAGVHIPLIDSNTRPVPSRACLPTPEPPAVTGAQADTLWHWAPPTML